MNDIETAPERTLDALLEFHTPPHIHIRSVVIPSGPTEQWKVVISFRTASRALESRTVQAQWDIEPTELVEAVEATIQRRSMTLCSFTSGRWRKTNCRVGDRGVPRVRRTPYWRAHFL
jgi:hypothetical protein